MEFGYFCSFFSFNISLNSNVWMNSKNFWFLSYARIIHYDNNFYGMYLYINHLIFFFYSMIKVNHFNLISLPYFLIKIDTHYTTFFQQKKEVFNILLKLQFKHSTWTGYCKLTKSLTENTIIWSIRILVILISFHFVQFLKQLFCVFRKIVYFLQSV